ncbi:MAG: nitrogenase component 1 [Syntrophobacteraceae bacterium]|nr:nitrogenase component 1 [Syntrophobacteraceae bacterium]
MAVRTTKESEIKMATMDYVSTTNACKLCKPLGACLAFRGIEGAVPMLHGSQGCATYMRRYIISHFREPMDIASSSLGEKHAVFGGGPNLKQGLKNLITKFGAGMIGVASTCLTETIGDDVPMIIREFRKEMEAEGGPGLPALVSVSTPSYSGTHMEGFHSAVRAVVDQLCTPDSVGEELAGKFVNLLPGFLSPADLRHLKEIVEDFGLGWVMLPDISETLDGPALEDYEKIPAGGTPISAIKGMGQGAATLEFGHTLEGGPTAGRILFERFGVPLHQSGVPIGLRETDAFFQALEKFSGRATPKKHELERGRLVDSYVDGHKYLFGKRAVVYGEEDLVIGLTAFLAEIGVKPVLCASGGRSGKMSSCIERVTAGLLETVPRVEEGADFQKIEDLCEGLAPDLLVGHSKGYRLSKKLGAPLVRVGFPIHDRFGGQRVLHAGYRGAQMLFDSLVNAILEKTQEESPIGYGYM